MNNSYIVDKNTVSFLKNFTGTSIYGKSTQLMKNTNLTHASNCKLKTFS